MTDKTNIEISIAYGMIESLWLKGLISDEEASKIKEMSLKN